MAKKKERENWEAKQENYMREHDKHMMESMWIANL